MRVRTQIVRWLGCLVRLDEAEDKINLSYFTISEFLTTSSEEVLSFTAREYMVSFEDASHVLNTCLKFLMHDNFRHMKLSTV